MELTGKLDQGDETILREMGIASAKIGTQLRDLPNGSVRKPAIQLYNDTSAMVGTLIALCKLPKTSSQAACVLLRSVVESCISMFAFCADPGKHADLYLNFPGVLDWQFACRDEQHFGCPFVPDHPENKKKVQSRKMDAKAKVEELGEPYLKSPGENPSEVLAEAIRKGTKGIGKFRPTWYPQSRQGVLEQEGMGWVHDVLYARLCSAVHSDAAASKVLSRVGRDSMVTCAMQWWGAAMYRLVETFRFRLSADHKGVIRMDYEALRPGSRRSR